MLYLIEKTNALTGTIFYSLSHQNDTAHSVSSFEDWEEFMILFPMNVAHLIQPDRNVEMPAHVESRINNCKALNDDAVYYATILRNKIMEILQENSFPDEVLDVLPEYITFAKFTPTTFFYKCTNNDTVHEIEDSIMNWYREEEEGDLTCTKDEYGVWQKKEEFEVEVTRV